MEKIKKLYGGLNLTWPKIIIFSVIIGVYTGLILMVPFLKGTSFRDIGVTYEWWVFFAIIIVVNCKGPLEAAFKCFVFFMISQPVIFLVQVPEIGFDLAFHYYFAFWFYLSLLTLPGGFIAYFIKLNNPVGAVILGIGNAIIAFSGVEFVIGIINIREYHILSILFCVAAIIISSLCLFKHKRERIITFIATGVFTALIAVYASTPALLALF